MFNKLRHAFFIIGFLPWVLAISAVVAPTVSYAAPAKKAAKKTSVKSAKSNKTKSKGASATDTGTAISGSMRVDDIRTAGNKKIETDAILAKVSAKIGGNITSDSVREDIEALFKTGYFYDVMVSMLHEGNKNILEYRVVEKPTVAEIHFDGVKELKEEEVKDAGGIKQYELLNLARLKEAADKITKFYEDKGYYLARVEPVVEDITKDESVKVTFKIQENDRVKIKKITFIGNKNISDAELKSKLNLSEEGYFSPVSSSGQYKQEALERDTLIIRFMYYNQGYIQAKVDRPQITISPDKKNIYLTYVIDEGLQYEVGDIDYDGDLLFPKDELREATSLRNSRLFVYETLQKDLSDLQAKYGDLGYAYANVIPRYKFRDADKKVDLIFEFDKGNKVYFGQINVVGNSKTRDKVVRRELRVSEGELYNETRRRKSLENIQRLGFFDDVNFKTSTPPGKPDIMNVDIVVKERNTGQIQLGAGYGTSSGFTLQGSVQQTNFLGKGENLGVSINFASNYSQYDLTFTEPYFNDSNWSLGFRVFQTTNDARSDYEERNTGGSVFTGYPLSDYTRLNFNYTYTKTDLSDAIVNGVSQTDPAIFPLSTATGESGMLGTSIEYDTRNDRFKTTKGMYARASYAQSGLGGNLNFFRGGADFRYFKNLFWDVIFRNSFSYGIVGRTSSQPVPFNQLYLLGGPYTLRGYRYATVGKQVFSQYTYNQIRGQYGTNVYSDQDVAARSYRYFGGLQQMLYQGELLFPMVKEAEMYGVAFFDTGEADDAINGYLYSDTGFGIRWFSPIGPLRFEWGFPLNRDPLYHDPVVFEFSIGTPF